MPVRGVGRGRCAARFDRPTVLALKYIPLVLSIVRKAEGSMAFDADPDDLIGCGFLALVRAARRFEPLRGRSFVSYAGPAIRGAVLDEARSRDWLSRGARRKVRRLETTLDRLQTCGGRRPTYADAAQELNLSAEESRVLLRALCCDAPVPISEVEDGVEGEGWSAPPAPPESDPHEIVARGEVRRMVTQAIGSLPPREREVVELYYFGEQTLREIGAKLGVTESRVCQLHGRAIRRLRQQPEVAGLMGN